MNNEQKREILRQQMELLAEASKVCGPEDLPKLTEAMVLVSREI